MINVEFFLEEQSAKEMLEGFLPRIFPEQNLEFEYNVFQGKQDLQKHLPRMLLGLNRYRGSNTHFIVLLDQDSSDCRKLKAKIRRMCNEAGCPDVLIRIICRELESWYLADLRAVEIGLGIPGLARRYQEKRIYRNPDAQYGPDEKLSKLTKGAYTKVRGSRKIGPHLDPENNRSPSFRNFITGIRHIAGTQR